MVTWRRGLRWWSWRPGEGGCLLVMLEWPFVRVCVFARACTCLCACSYPCVPVPMSAYVYACRYACTCHLYRFPEDNPRPSTARESWLSHSVTPQEVTWQLVSVTSLEGDDTLWRDVCDKGRHTCSRWGWGWRRGGARIIIITMLIIPFIIITIFAIIFDFSRFLHHHHSPSSSSSLPPASLFFPYFSPPYSHDFFSHYIFTSKALQESN